MKYILISLSLFLIGCEQTGSAPKLQAHLSAAQASSVKTTKHITAAKKGLDAIDYKSGRALKLHDQGIERPE